MEISLYLAKLFGLYMLIVSILLTIRQDLLQKIAQEIAESPMIIVFTGALNLLGGLAILIGHPVWGYQWPCVISLLAVLMLIKGIVRIGFPEATTSCITALIQNKNYLTTIFLITALIGLFLTVHGFTG